MRLRAERGRPAYLRRRPRIATAATVAALALLLGAAAAPRAQKPATQQKAPAGQAKSKPGSKPKPERQAGPPKPRARAWILIDALDGKVLAAGAPDRQLPIASTTKLMTSYLALKRLKPKQRLKAPVYHSTSPEESLLGLDLGERMTVKDLLYAMLLPSANDAAETVALGISGSEKRFVALMNQTARALGLDQTHYGNPIGLDQGANHSSARNLVTLADRLLENPLFRRIVATPSITLRSGDTPRKVTTRNTLLLERPDLIVGVKTGHTIQAGYVLVAAARRNGATLLSAVLGTSSEPSRDAETLRLLDYGFSQYRSRRPVTRGEELASPGLDYRSDHLALVAKREVTVSIRRGQRVSVRVAAPDELSGAVDKGETLGRVVVSVDGRLEGTSPLVASESVAAATTMEKAVDTAEQPLILIPAGVFVIVVGVLLAIRRRREAPEGSQQPNGLTAPGPTGPPEPEEPPEPEQPQQPEKPKPSRRSKRKESRERTPEERRAMHDQRMRRRRERGQ
jgi:serine-type D-Ala-D-Ala carboxypeptidase (penicillin-binding protein 5/6)